MADGQEKSFCFIEGTSIDQSAAATVTDLHESVWYRMKPPKINKIMYAPFVSARQLDLVRNILTGKTSLKPREPKDVEISLRTQAPKAGSATLPRRDVVEKPDLKTKKSSVRFLNKSAYD